MAFLFLYRTAHGFRLNPSRISSRRGVLCFQKLSSDLYPKSTSARTTKKIMNATLRAAVIGSALGISGGARAIGTVGLEAADKKILEIQPLFPENDFTEADFRNAVVVKKPTDLRKYRPLLLPNKLRVLLVSDKSTNRGAAALDVHVGSFSDPSDIPGLAHFAEHMCFLGTRKYPDESDFRLV